MNYKDFTLGDWIGHISGVIEDETTLDGNEMRDLVEFLTTMQEPCEDEYIKVPKKALKYRTAGMVAYNVEWLKNHFDMERVLICGAQEPKTGQWNEDIDNERKWDKVRFYCSECGHWQSYGKTKYCPDCGAKMESEGNHDTDAI